MLTTASLSTPRAKTLADEQQRVSRVIATMLAGEEPDADLENIAASVNVASYMAEYCGLSLEPVLALAAEKFGRYTVKKALLARREADMRWIRVLPSLPPNVLRCLTAPTCVGAA